MSAKGGKKLALRRGEHKSGLGAGPIPSQRKKKVGDLAKGRRSLGEVARRRLI